MRKKIVLFSSILATLPTVLATVTESFEKVFTALPNEIWNPVLAFALVAGIINGALSLTNLGKEGGDRRGFGLISGSLGAMFSIFVYTTGFDLIGFVMPYLLLILLLFLFSTVMVFVAPQDDKKNASRASGVVLIITGALLYSVNGLVANVSAADEAVGVTLGINLNESIFMLTPYTTIVGFIFIVWGFSKVVSSFSDDEDNPSFWGGVGNMNPFSGSGSSGGSSGSGSTAKLKIGKIKASSSPINVGDKVTFEVTKIKGGRAPYAYRWTITETGAPATIYTVAKPAHTFTNGGASDINLTVKDADGTDINAPVFSIVVAAAPPLTASFTIHTTGPPYAVVPNGSAILPVGEQITFTPESDPTKLGGVGPYTYEWIVYPPNPADILNAPPGAATPPLGTPSNHNNEFVANGAKLITLQITDSHGTIATETSTFTVI